MFKVMANIIGDNTPAEQVAEFATRGAATDFAKDQNSAYGNEGAHAGEDGRMNFYVVPAN